VVRTISRDGTSTARTRNAPRDHLADALSSTTRPSDGRMPAGFQRGPRARGGRAHGASRLHRTGKPRATMRCSAIPIAISPAIAKEWRSHFHRGARSECFEFGTAPDGFQRRTWCFLAPPEGRTSGIRSRRRPDVEGGFVHSGNRTGRQSGSLGGGRFSSAFRAAPADRKLAPRDRGGLFSNRTPSGPPASIRATEKRLARALDHRYGETEIGPVTYISDGKPRN